MVFSSMGFATTSHCNGGGRWRKLPAAFIGSQGNPEWLQPLRGLSFVSDKIMEHLSHSALMPTHSHSWPRAAGPTPACSQGLMGQPCCLDSLRSPQLVAPRGTHTASLQQASCTPAALCPGLLIRVGCQSRPLLSSALQALSPEVQRELLGS